MNTLAINIRCGRETCAEKPGVFCPFVGTRKMGTTYVCLLFPSEDRASTDLKEDKPGGSLQRLAVCKTAEALADG